MSTHIQVRRDSSAAWNVENPKLADGEIAYDKTERKLKIGDGASDWNALGFVTTTPYDDTQIKADIASKLDADKIWTGTEAEYNALTPDANTLYFIV
jgi:hypothetical protein